MPPAKEPGGFDAVHDRHADVHHDDVGREAIAHVDRCRTVGSDGHDGDVGLEFEQRCEVAPDAGVVVGDHRPDGAGQDPDTGRMADTIHPPFGDGPITRCPPQASARSRIPIKP